MPGLTSGKTIIPTLRIIAGIICNPHGIRKLAVPLIYEHPNSTKYWRKMPQVMDHCCIDTSRPRIAGAVISDWYSGTTADASPTATPDTTRPATSIPRSTAAHCRMLPSTHTQPDRITTFLRPIRSARLPTTSAPTSEPAGIAATIAPWAFEPGLPNVFL